MRSVRHIDDFPAGTPLLADDLTEFHAARLLLLLSKCGVNGQIDGLTKLAKLDFFVRYPSFFAEACRHENKAFEPVTDTVESPMVRHHYGPWDHRYYQVLAFLEARGLIQITQISNSFDFALMPDGADVADRLAKSPEFAELVAQMRQVKRAFGNWKGATIKNLIYKVFEKEVADRELGEVIEP